MLVACSFNTVSVVSDNQKQFLVLCNTPHRCSETAKRICSEFRITWRNKGRIIEFRSNDSAIWEYGIAIDCGLRRAK